jgi:glycine/D-amino acid oxidase-like deaminating enzyme
MARDMTNAALLRRNMGDQRKGAAVALDQADVVVVGGGIVGLCTAYALRARGFDVAVVEQRFVAFGASGRNSGCIWLQTMHSGPELDLARAGEALYEGFIDELGPTFEYRRKGGLFFFETEQQRAIFDDYVGERRGQGLDVDLLDASAARELSAAVPASALGAVFCAQDAQFNGQKFVRGLGDACRRQRVRIYENTAVLGLLKRGDSVCGVTTVRGEISAQAVVWAAGAWSGILEREGVAVAVEPVRVGLVQTQPVDRRSEAIVHGPLGAGRYRVLAELDSFDAGAFPPLRSVEDQVIGYQDMIAQNAEGNLLIGHTVEGPGSLNPHISMAATKLMLDTALTRYPTYSADGVTGLWAGLVGFTPDGLPIISPVEAIKGLYINAGHAFGNSSGPVSGELMAELIAGDVEPARIDPFRLDRPALSNGLVASGHAAVNW